MTTLVTLPRDAALHMLRFAFFPGFDYASPRVNELKFLLRDRDLSFDGLVEKRELVELARTSDATSGTDGNVNLRGMRRGVRNSMTPPTGADAKLPPSLVVPTIPRPEEARRQAPFDTVPAGVTLGLNSMKAAVHVSTVSQELKHVVMDDSLWSGPLAALEEAFKAGEDPRTNRRNRDEGILRRPVRTNTETRGGRIRGTRCQSSTDTTRSPTTSRCCARTF
tara:strand:- start:5557 stop:6222 length:666 start_codon:yes stop_codon:yes gene_type:complete